MQVPASCCPTPGTQGSARALELGAVGGNLEHAGPGGPFGIDEARSTRSRAGRGPQRDFRAERPHRHVFLRHGWRPCLGDGRTGGPDLDAGADCVFVPGVVEEDTIRRLVVAIPGPLNVVAGLANVIDAATLFSLGVQRVSLGGSLARAAPSVLERAGRNCLTPEH